MMQMKSTPVNLRLNNELLDNVREIASFMGKQVNATISEALTKYVYDMGKGLVGGAKKGYITGSYTEEEYSKKVKSFERFFPEYDRPSTKVTPLMEHERNRYFHEVADIPFEEPEIRSKPQKKAGAKK